MRHSHRLSLSLAFGHSLVRPRRLRTTAARKDRSVATAPGRPQARRRAPQRKLSACAQAAAKIIPIVMGDSPLQENLRKLTDEIGGRVSGSPEMAKAVDWGVAAFRAAGVDVHTEKYMLPVAWSEGATRLEVLGPVQFPVSLVSEGLSPATPAGGLEAKLIDVGDGTEQEFAKPAPQ